MRSIIQNNKECYVCKSTLNLHDHHIFYGANRKNSEKYGMKIWLCGDDHNLSKFGIHFNKELDLKVKMIAQKKFEELYSRELFMETFKRSYL